MAPDTCVFKIVPRRWLKCGILHLAISSFLWLALGSRLPNIFSWRPSFPSLLPSLSGCIRFLIFLSSQILFLLGESIVIGPEDKDAASLRDIISGFLKLAWRAAVGAPHDGASAYEAVILASKLQTTADRLLFCFLSSSAGFLSMLSLSWGSQHSFGRLPPLEEGIRGAFLGIVYGVVYIFKRRLNVTFPIIQRQFFFSLKMGLSEAARTGLKLSIVALPFAEAAILILNSKIIGAFTTEANQTSLLWREASFCLRALFVTFCWELCHHLVQVVHTKRHAFAPPLGSSAAETSPNELLLTVLEETDRSSMLHYLGVLDLCMVSESNVDTWRRAALFEETGESYQRVISICLKQLDMITVKLAGGLDGSLMNMSNNVLEQQMQSPGRFPGSTGVSFEQIFRDFQLCCWCARTVAVLTARSKNEDRYGVAQLRGCNGMVVSSLLSCLLVHEVYLGRRSSTQSLHFIGPNSIKWTVPSRGTVEDMGKKQSFPSRKKSILHKKAYAMADVLRTSLYEIVSVFRNEMMLGRSGSSGFLAAERDWLSKCKPLYGTHEMHVQKLGLFLDFRVS